MPLTKCREGLFAIVARYAGSLGYTLQDRRGILSLVAVVKGGGAMGCGSRLIDDVDFFSPITESSDVGSRTGAFRDPPKREKGSPSRASNVPRIRRTIITGRALACD
jgi:hypothetical protein